MLTPRFEITQTDTDVSITVHAPYANIKDTEVYVDGDDFRFYSTPYYLRLKLPGEIEENDASSGSYDCEKGDFFLKFSKVKKGEHFENLDMITTLLAPPKKKSTIVPNIEVIGNPSANSDDINDNSNEDDVDGNSVDGGDQWFVNQKITENIVLPLVQPKYGFANKISGALASFEEAWIKEIIDLPKPDVTPQSERRNLREQQELDSFNEEHYMADLMQQEYVEPYLSYTPEWETLKSHQVNFSVDEADLLKELPNKQYLLDSTESRSVLLGLVDILYASCYNHRTTMGENTVESGWTICKLSSTLCWFETFNDMNEVVKASIRRSLCYPLFRNWELSMKVFDDVKKVIQLGRKYIIKRLCEIHSLFNTSYEPLYLLNQLYIKDYMIWLQQIQDWAIESIIPIINDVHPTKAEMGFDLVELEEAAHSVQEEDLVIENAVHEVYDELDKLVITDNEKIQPKLPTSVGHKFLKYLRSSSSSSDSSSDTDSESDSDSSSTSSSTTSSSTTSSSTSSSSLDSDDASEPELVLYTN